MSGPSSDRLGVDMTDLEWHAWLGTDAGKDAMIRLLWDLVASGDPLQ